ncbi:MAG: response regulator [Actinomycetes bacterium]
MDSTVGTGSTFWMQLATVPEPGASAGDTRPRPTAHSPTAPSTGTILYVEDGLTQVHVVERALAHRPGLDLLVAMQADDGLALAHQHYPALILLDAHLPDTSSDEILGRLHADPGLRTVPVVVLGADPADGQAERPRDADVATLANPFDVAALVAVVDRLLPLDLTDMGGLAHHGAPPDGRRP